MKEHVLREMINGLTHIARTYHDHDSLRERIKGRVMEAFHEDSEWYRQLVATHSKDQEGK
jgi:hypothetical protein